ncbi:hypothetical protein MBRU_12135 [Mycolicibacterium brumae DSM 44177]|nr:hypothetical protein MBRU_12135 [Mycolicibacterium brumae DSM 44177]
MVGKNAKRLREQMGLTLAQLGERLAALGHPMSTASISELERGVRKATVDDLTVFAAALHVSPVALLMPESILEDTEMVSLTGVDRALPMLLLPWLRGQEPFDEGDLRDPDAVEQFRRRSLPPWAWGSRR